MGREKASARIVFMLYPRVESASTHHVYQARGIQSVILNKERRENAAVAYFRRGKNSSWLTMRKIEMSI